MREQYVCKVASPDEMERKWDYEISRHTDDRENWIIWKTEAKDNFREGKAIPYYGILDGEIICEATAIIHPDAAQNSEGLIDDRTAYLCAFRTNEPFRGKGYFSVLFRFMLDDLRKRGYTRVTLGVEPGETVNKEIYRHYGFTGFVKAKTEKYPDGTEIHVEYFLKNITGEI